MKKIIIPLLLLVFSFNTFAQRNGKMQERIKAQKVAFITERLDLSPKEAQQFWPIYNAFEDKIETIRKNDLKGVREAMKRGNLSESEAQKVLDKFMEVEEKLHQLKKQLVKDLGTVIPPQKIIALKAAEDAFKKKLFDIMKQRREKMLERHRKN